MTFIGGYFEKMPTSIQIMSVYERNGKNIFNGTINLSPNENIFIIARIKTLFVLYNTRLLFFKTNLFDI